MYSMIKIVCVGHSAGIRIWRARNKSENRLKHSDQMTRQMSLIYPLNILKSRSLPAFPWSKPFSFSISALSSSKLNTSKFWRRRSGFVLFGIATMPLWIICLNSIWATDLLCFLAISFATGFSRMLGISILKMKEVSTLMYCYTYNTYKTLARCNFLHISKHFTNVQTRLKLWRVL